MPAGSAGTANTPPTRNPAAAARAMTGSSRLAILWMTLQRSRFREMRRGESARRLGDVWFWLSHRHQVDRHRDAADHDALQRRVLSARLVALRAGRVVGLLQRQRAAALHLVVLLQLRGQVHRVAYDGVFQ